MSTKEKPTKKSLQDIIENETRARIRHRTIPEPYSCGDCNQFGGCRSEYKAEPEWMTCIFYPIEFELKK